MSVTRLAYVISEEFNEASSSAKEALSSTAAQSSPSCNDVPPAQTTTGTTPNCCQFYIVKEGDTCGSIEAKYAISDQLFGEMNTGIDANCDNLDTGIAYVFSSPLAYDLVIKTNFE
jgi:hypothetical protein